MTDTAEIPDIAPKRLSPQMRFYYKNQSEQQQRFKDYYQSNKELLKAKRRARYAAKKITLASEVMV